MNRLYYETTLTDKVLTSDEAKQDRLRSSRLVTVTANVGPGGEAGELERELAQYDDITEQNVPGIDSTTCKLADLTVKNFLIKSNQIRDHLALTDFSQDIIVMPNMFFSGTISASRFKNFTNRLLDADDPKFEYIRMVNRRAIVKKLRDQLKSNRCCMLYGPQGCGKSFVLIQLVAALTKEGHFVVFINNSGKLLRDIFNILAAKLLTISTVDPNRITKFRKNFSDPDATNDSNEEIIWKFIDEAVEIIKNEQNQNVYFVLDQLDQARVHVKFLTKLAGGLFNCVFASSANNNPTDFDLKMEKLGVDEDLVRFNDQQFMALCKLLDHKFTRIERDQIMSITGAVALQLYKFVEQVKGAETQINTQALLQVQIDTYRNRMRQNNFDGKNLEKYLDELPGATLNEKANKKQASVENVCDMILKDTKHDNSWFDRRYIYRSSQKDDKGVEYYPLKAISTLAFTGIVRYYKKRPEIQPFLDHLQQWFEMSRLAQGALGSITKQYILYELFKNSLNDPNQVAKREIVFPVEVQGPAGDKKAVTVDTKTIVMKDYAVLYFDGTSPTRDKIERNMVFIPNDERYPGFDFFYYELQSNTLYPVQITIEQNAMDHVARNDINKKLVKALNDWRLVYLPDDAQIFEIWLVRGTDEFMKAETERRMHLNVVFFNKVDSLPLLATVDNKASTINQAN